MKFVLYLDCPKEKLVERIMNRAQEAGDQKRTDDNMETLLKRFETFNEQSMPVINTYEQMGKVKKIDAS